MSKENRYIPFSERTCVKAAAPQLELGQVSQELRHLLEYALDQEIDDHTHAGPMYLYFSQSWRRVPKDLHVKFLNKSVATYSGNVSDFRTGLFKAIKTAPYHSLFDLIEFFIRHPDCSSRMRGAIADAFVKSKAAYRIHDGLSVAIGSREIGEAVEAAIDAAGGAGADASRSHLLAAGKHLRKGDWSASLRDSIHAVEAIAKQLSRGTTTLGPALNQLEKQGYVHAGLKSAFAKLYGYTNDEDGIRHALSDSEAKVDETDALFVLGACASFVKYLIATDSQSNQNPA